jgi:hypothetical protein
MDERGMNMKKDSGLWCPPRDNCYRLLLSVRVSLQPSSNLVIAKLLILLWFTLTISQCHSYRQPLL